MNPRGRLVVALLALVTASAPLVGCVPGAADPRVASIGRVREASQGPSGWDGERSVTTTTEAAAGDLYADPANWLCRGDVDGDLCDGDLDVTVVRADGSLDVVAFQPAGDAAAADCFYIYPTISADPGVNSDLTASRGEEGFAVVQQAALLGEACRVFAPVYRQTTLTALATGQWSPESQAIAFGDVVAAFRYYLDHFNEGRGVVLVGHSQGAGLARLLLQQVVEPDPAVQELLVSAFLAGTTVGVPDGADVGGDLATPLCRTPDGFGCVVNWSTYRADPPPPANALFGADPGGGLVAACTNPAALAGGPADLDARFPAAPDVSILSDLGSETAASTGTSTWLDPTAGTITTPFVALPGLVSGECVATEGHHALLVSVNADAADPRADDIGGDLTPEWGLHLIDVNVVLGDLIALVRSQSAAWAAGR